MNYIPISGVFIQMFPIQATTFKHHINSTLQTAHHKLSVLSRLQDLIFQRELLRGDSNSGYISIQLIAKHRQRHLKKIQSTYHTEPSNITGPTLRSGNHSFLIRCGFNPKSYAKRNTKTFGATL
jgi:hypothetical protein